MSDLTFPTSFQEIGVVIRITNTIIPKIELTFDLFFIIIPN